MGWYSFKDIPSFSIIKSLSVTIETVIQAWKVVTFNAVKHSQAQMQGQNDNFLHPF